MEISCFNEPVNGKIGVSVDYHYDDGTHGHSATVNVWIEETDSRKEIERRALAAAKEFLERAIQAHDQL